MTDVVMVGGGKEGCPKLGRDIDEQKDWAKDWQMEFNLVILW